MVVLAKPCDTNFPKIHMDFGRHGICRGLKEALLQFLYASSHHKFPLFRIKKP